MGNWLQRTRDRLEKLVFAGLKPDAPVIRKKSKLESLLESAEDLAGRGLQSEQKALPGPVTTRRKLTIGVAIVVVCVGIYGLMRVLQSPAARNESQAPAPPQTEIVPKDLVIEKNKDLEIVAIDFDRSAEPHKITGTLRNLTGKVFARCEVSFEITTKAGAQVGAVATTVHNLQPHASTNFSIPVPQSDAAFAMVRELRSE